MAGWRGIVATQQRTKTLKAINLATGIGATGNGADDTSAIGAAQTAAEAAAPFGFRNVRIRQPATVGFPFVLPALPSIMSLYLGPHRTSTDTRSPSDRPPG